MSKKIRNNKAKERLAIFSEGLKKYKSLIGRYIAGYNEATINNRYLREGKLNLISFTVIWRVIDINGEILVVKPISGQKRDGNYITKISKHSSQAVYWPFIDEKVAIKIHQKRKFYAYNEKGKSWSAKIK